jgi:dihydrofolate synthase/folylpolyglutamate synthase
MEQGEGASSTQLSWLVQSAALPVACGSLYLVAELLPLLNATD